MLSSQRMVARLRISARLVALALSACATDDGVPEGKLARVGDVVFGPEDVAAVAAQLGAYAQLRFAGGEGHAALLMSLVDAEVLAQEALRQGLGDDPRVEHALLEEEATVFLSAELERRVPHAAVAADTERLRAWYAAHADELAVPEQRSVEGVAFPDWAQAERAHAALNLGTTTIAELGEVVTTPLQARDDHEFPGFHAALFDPSVVEGALLPHPVVIGERVFVGRVRRIVAAAPPPLDDPATLERVVAAVRAPLLEQARAAVLAELAGRYPERAASGPGM